MSAVEIEQVKKHYILQVKTLLTNRRKNTNAPSYSHKYSKGKLYTLLSPF